MFPLYLLGVLLDPKDECSMFVRNVGKLDYKASHLRRE